MRDAKTVRAERVMVVAAAMATALLLARAMSAQTVAIAPAYGGARAGVGIGALRGGSGNLSAPDAAVLPVQAKSANETLHVVSGRSVVLNTAATLRRVYVGDPTVLQTFTSSANQVVVTGKKTGVSSLMLWDTTGASRLYTVDVDLDAEDIQEAVRNEYPGENIRATVAEGRVQLTGRVSSDAVADGVMKLAQLYAKDATSSLVVMPAPHGKQVSLRVRIIEVDRAKAAQFGINIFSGGDNIGFGGTQQFASTGIGAVTPGAATTLNLSNPLNFFIYNQNLNVGVAVADLAQKQVLQILAEPTLTSLSGQPASFLSGGEFPFPVVQGTGTYTAITIQFRPFGVKLDFTPTVNADGTVRLKVAPEVSALDYTNAVTISGYTIPALSTRRAQTEVELKDGQTFSISGLLDHRTTDIMSHTPGIASIPILGELFKSKNNTQSTTELVVMVTATVVDPLSETVGAVPEGPAMVTPNLDTPKFDQQFTTDLKKAR
jgi:pilus assembly protein CpaC